MFPILLLLLLLSALASAATFNVRDYGAKGDSLAKDTVAIQRALDAASAAGGGAVSVPAGKYLSGTIHLRSNTTLHLNPGAVILASTDDADFDPYEKLPFESVSDKETTYFHYALLAAENIHDVAITGEGVIDGNRSKRGGPKTIALKVSRNIAIRGITVRNSPNYSISFWGCDFVVVDGVHIVNGYADGIDPDASRDVRISNSYIDVYDDAICPKASPSNGMADRRSVENLTVTNCVLRTNCSNFKFGTESSADFKNIAVSNCAMLPRDTGRAPVSGISLESVDGARIQGVVISNITMQGVRVPIFLRLANRGRGLSPKIAGTLEDVSISNVSARGASFPSSITGIPGARVRRVSLDGIRLTHSGGFQQVPSFAVEELIEKYPEGTMWGSLPAWALYARHSDAVTLRNLEVAWNEPDTRPALAFDDLTDLLDGFQARSAAPAGPVIWFRDVLGAFIHGSRTVSTPLFLDVQGKTRGVVLTGNDLGAARRVQR